MLKKGKKTKLETPYKLEAHLGILRLDNFRVELLGCWERFKPKLKFINIEV